MLSSGPEQWGGYWDVLLWFLVGLLISRVGMLAIVGELGFQIYVGIFGTQELEKWKERHSTKS